MPRPRVTERVSWLQIEQLKRRQVWPASLLAEFLGCDRRTIYRYLDQNLLKAGPQPHGGITTASILELLATPEGKGGER